ncbi:hypothetical protein GUJ93_ZPchr0008g14071 [Zizania palustris]|uniref:Uncharacterized protein n=1 Tax=Zizania palustris TaxID=103762 RepID=A0A8J5VJM3_ZIZPA|nr:hypothetical protein GUJ93_ZPchr0008g14071 [Zizania palustris]
MARLLAQTLTLARPAAAPASFPLLRGLATKVEVIEIDLADDDADNDAAPVSSAPGSPSVEVVGIRRLEEAIHGVMVRRAAPDWLPFVPGASFWVPPMRRPHGFAEFVGRFTASRAPYAEAGPAHEPEVYAPMTEEEALSLSTARGWPSAAYFVQGKSPHSKKRSRKGATHTDDEES